MMRRLTLSLLLTLLASVGCAQAADDCLTQKLSADETASAYLDSYRTKCIVQAKRAPFLAKWELDAKPADTLSASETLRLVPAWGDIAKGFEVLAEQSPGLESGGMRHVYSQLAARAAVAGQGLKKGLEVRRLPDIALFRKVAWQDKAMTLLEYDQPNEPYFNELDLGLSINHACAEPSSPLCLTAIEHGKQLMLYLDLASFLASKISNTAIQKIAQQVSVKAALWDRYTFDSKPMLPFDFMATDFMEPAKKDVNGVPVPPTRQWFFMHPSVGMEYNSAAVDGQQFKPILYLEAFGVNYWDKANRLSNLPVLNHLSGVSLVVSYADRAGVKDTGVGVLFTFDNVYSIAVTRYGSKTGISLSLDLANLFREKLKPKYQELLWSGR